MKLLIRFPIRFLIKTLMLLLQLLLFLVFMSILLLLQLLVMFWVMLLFVSAKGPRGRDGTRQESRVALPAVIEHRWRLP